MKYLKEFKKVVTHVESDVNSLRHEEFIKSCTDFLRLEGKEIDINGNDDVSVDIHEGPGLYCFWINLESWYRNEDRPWQELISLFCDEWGVPEKIKFTPKANMGNIKKLLTDYEEKDTIALYVGKSENVRKRVEQHINLEVEKKTYALKLRRRCEQLKGVEINVTALPLTVDKKNYFLVGLVEMLVREKMVPIIGKQ